MTEQEPPGGSDAGAVGSAPRPGWRPGPVWILPAFVVVWVVIITGLGVSGSSVAAMRARPAADSSLLIGLPRPIRSDEWNTRTPLVLGQVKDDLAATSDIGIGEHDMAVLYDLPTSDWSTVLRPHLWGYLVLPVENAFAFEWWALAAALVLGTYALLMMVVRDWRWAAVGALALYGSPFFHWWYLAQAIGVAGYATGATAALLASFRSDASRHMRWVLVGVAGVLLAAFGQMLYPPSQVPLAIVCGLLAVGTVARWLIDGHTTWRRVLVNCAVAGGMAALALGVFVLAHRGALKAIADTAYPGRRRIVGGDGDVDQLTTAWFGWDYVRDGERLGPIIFANQSEASGFLVLGLYLLAAIPLVWSSVAGVGRRYRYPIIGLVTALLLVGAHCYVGLPGWLTRITLLDRVQPTRAIIGLGVGSLLLLVLVGVAMREAEVPRWRRRTATVVLVAVTVGYVISLGQQFRAAGGPIGTIGIGATVAVAVVVAGTFFWRPMLSVGLLAAYGLLVSLPVNPLYRGLGPLDQQPLVGDIAAASDGDRGTWLSVNGDVTTVLTAQGYEPLSGVNLYPDAEAWRILDPTGASEETWNRYAHTTWALVPGQPTPRIELLTPDVVSVTVDPCGTELDQLNVGHVASEGPLDAACLTLDRTTTTERGAVIYLYDRAFAHS